MALVHLQVWLQPEMQLQQPTELLHWQPPQMGWYFLYMRYLLQRMHHWEPERSPSSALHAHDTVLMFLAALCTTALFESYGETESVHHSGYLCCQQPTLADTTLHMWCPVCRNMWPMLRTRHSGAVSGMKTREDETPPFASAVLKINQIALQAGNILQTICVFACQPTMYMHAKH